MSFNSLFGLGSHSPDSSLEGWWPLQETTSTQADDYSGNANHGTINGMGGNPVTATGPNSWLTSAYDFDGVDDWVSVASGISIPASGFTLGGFLVATFTGGTLIPLHAGEQAVTAGPHARIMSSTLWQLTDWGVNGVNQTVSSTGDWHCVSIIREPSQVTAYIPGNTPDVSGSTTFLGASNGKLGIGASSLGNFETQSKAANVFAFSRALALSEVDEINSGPEPVNTSAPLVTGLAPEGSTLSCSTGTWGLDSPFSGGSNGTITYSYQWTRNGSDISGATSSTYVTQAADVGNDIGCRVRASNSGGFDSAADTDSSNTVTVTSSGGGISIPVVMAHYRRMRVA